MEKMETDKPIMRGRMMPGPFPALLATIFLCLLPGFANSALQGEPDGGRRLGLVIGVQEFADARIRSLQYAADDARALHELLTDPRYGRFDTGATTIILNGDATVGRVREALRGLAAAAQPGDTVLVYFSSHGVQEAPAPGTPASAEGLSYWVLHDTRLDSDAWDGSSVRLVPGTALEHSELANLLDGISARRFIVLVDCCYSAATVARLTRGEWRVAVPRDPFRALQGRGRVIITASDGRERSLELDSLRHGVFTYFLLEGFRGRADMNRDNMVEVAEIWGYLEGKITDLARRHGYSQTPTFQAVRLTHGFPLTTYPLGAGSAVEPDPQVAAAPALLPVADPPGQAGSPQPLTAIVHAPMPAPAPLTDSPYPPAPTHSAPSPSLPGLQFAPVDGAPDLALFEISATEVTNSQFKAFLEANPKWTKDGIHRDFCDGDYLCDWTGNDFPPGRGDYPVTRVSWFAAKAFADWAGCALPTEARWRAAAAGKPAAAGERAIRVSPAGTSPGMVAAGSADAAAVSWGGKPVLHLGGNVAEWCADVYLPPGPRDNVLAGQLRAEPYRRPVRGDSFMNGGIPCGADCAIIADPQLCAPDVGFRVARGR